MRGIDKTKWEKRFYDGIENMITTSEFKKFRTRHPAVIKDWYDSQVNNKIIKTIDYNGGGDKIIAKVNLALGGGDEN
ncbi:hypothetical protein H8D83_01025 [Candidatus Woesearchaeota archaeon]|nr:hypothetical protein [Candidatus Woesearchaeota archaeon]